MQIKARAGLDQFDPRPWLPGDNRVGWRKANTRIDANVDVDIRLAAPPASAAPAPVAKGTGDPVQQAMAALHAVLAQLRGKLALNLRPSELAGIAIDGSAALQVTGVSPGPGEAGVQLSLQTGGNQVKANYKTRADRPAADLFDLAVNAPELASLAPLASLLGLPVKSKSGKPLGGSLGACAPMPPPPAQPDGAGQGGHTNVARTTPAHGPCDAEPGVDDTMLDTSSMCQGRAGQACACPRRL